jgi:transglutaminase-like putative cysteine protease
MPAWLSGVAVLMLAWRAWLAWRRLPLPPGWLRSLLVVISTIAVLVQFKTLFGQNAGVALLINFLALKQMEARKPRDGLTIVFLSYFLALSQFFYTQTIPAALAALTTLVVATATLGSLNREDPPPGELLRHTGLLLAQALPLMLLLFVLFPRVQGPLWGLPRDAYSALTGLSDSMTPGSISNLSRSDNIAFRVRFDGEPPPRHQLYWRGPVLTEFDGQTWRPLRIGLSDQLPYAASPDTGYRYTVTLEPHNQPWLFALELPSLLPDQARISPDYLLHARNRITQRLRYELRSVPVQLAGLNEHIEILERALALPDGTNPRTRELARHWRTVFRTDAAVLRAAITFFQNQGLIYTLNPPLLGRHTADEFLFDTKRGFCEHFANAFVVALRAAAVPARVVTGYQGGEINPVDGYLTVRQFDAHAWAEVWLAGQGWVRVDPTAAAVPNRISGNLADAVPAGDPLPLMVRVDLDWLRQLRFRLDAVANGWNQWVLGYNPERQRQFLNSLGMRSPDWQGMTAVLAGLSGLVILALTAWALHQRRRLDPAAAAWRRFARRLGRRGLPPHPWEGPQDYAERVAAARPDIAADVRAIAEIYGGVRYGGRPALDELKRRVASFRP